VATRIVIIGGGPAGYEAALVAAGRGRAVAEVTVVDSDGIGGACVLWDCVPSKTLIASTGVRTELRRASPLGFDIAIEDAKISLDQIHNRVKTLAKSQSTDIGHQLLRAGVNVVAGRSAPGEGHDRRRQGRDSEGRRRADRHRRQSAGAAQRGARWRTNPELAPAL
jgi:dihydrolipoamide dehydrogenase